MKGGIKEKIKGGKRKRRRKRRKRKEEGMNNDEM